ncbi:polysaccharide pyruvyl transferase family protein [Geomonas anaerohicana]|uniref:Polysaccharide pyruvyl transferase family protein n=1 Tax=Geomonas anaerohicana TaxID=2798583 RepID=A0ABS0YHH0_9BACT|nr:polysaccharide pyruvyl transferase family protein [Geomonas anaerohicana]MBJ6751574.1 polysaccharide pyruvyl transferase family protein [Geomonas anaerohicana]
MTKVALFNDTGNFPHVGCLAVSQAHDKMLRKAGAEITHRHFVTELKDLWRGSVEASADAVRTSAVSREMEEVDAVIVNGEGTIHHGAGLHLLALLKHAQLLKKRTFLVNCVIQDCIFYHDVMRDLDDLTVRDAHSLSYLADAGVPGRVVLDSILEADFKAEPTVDFKNKIVITDFHHSMIDVGAALKKLQDELQDEAVYYPLEDKLRFDDWQHFVANLRTARLIVTGRHHGVYLSALAKRPFVALPSNTWKIEGTLSLFGERINVLTDYRGLVKACEDAVSNRSLYDDFSDFLQQQRPLTTFRGVPTHSGSSFARFIKNIFLRA